MTAPLAGLPPHPACGRAWACYSGRLMVERLPVRTGLARRGSGWRTWIVALTIALAGVTIAEAICHEEHAVDQDCAVCQLRHQPAAEPSAFLQVGYAVVAEPTEPADDGGWIAPGHFRRLPARGPPA